jgi:hypothetical protein
MLMRASKNLFTHSFKKLTFMAALPPPPRRTATCVLPHALSSIPATTMHCFSSSTALYSTDEPLFFIEYRAQQSHHCLIVTKFLRWKFIIYNFFCCIFFGRPECVGHSFAYFGHFLFLRDVWIRTQSAAVASARATNLATHLIT